VHVVGVLLDAGDALGEPLLFILSRRVGVHHRFFTANRLNSLRIGDISYIRNGEISVLFFVFSVCL
jgi:hypothetical protein